MKAACKQIPAVYIRIPVVIKHGQAVMDVKLISLLAHIALRLNGIGVLALVLVMEAIRVGLKGHHAVAMKNIAVKSHDVPDTKTTRTIAVHFIMKRHTIIPLVPAKKMVKTVDGPSQQTQVLYMY